MLEAGRVSHCQWALARGAARKVVASSIDWSAAGAGGAQVDVAAPGSAGRGGECLDADIGAGVGDVNHHRLAVPGAGVDPDMADRGGGRAEEGVGPEYERNVPRPCFTAGRGQRGLP